MSWIVPTRPLSGLCCTAFLLGFFGSVVPGAAGAEGPVEASSAPLELPDSLAAATFSEWLPVFNGRDPEEVEKWVHARFSPRFGDLDRLVRFHLDIAAEVGTLTPHSVLDTSPERLEVLTRASGGSWVKAWMVVDPEPPHQIIGFRLLSTDPPGAELAEADAPAWPETALGRLAAEFVVAFNADDAESMRAFETRYRSKKALAERPMEERLEQVRGLRSRFGELTLHRVLGSGAGGLVVLLRASGTGDLLRFRFEPAADEPSKLEAVAITPAGPPEIADLELEPGPLAAMLTEAREAVGVPALAVAWMEDGAVRDLAVVGTRWLDGPPVMRDDLFHLGSVTKSITASMIGRLVEEGALEWGARVGDMLPDLPMRAEYREVTLEALLQHRGRVPAKLDFDDAEMARLNALPGSPTEQRAAFLREVLQEEPLPPGMAYSNAGYTLAGYIAEVATGESWQDLVRRTVLAPLGLGHTGFGWPATPARPDQPRGHYSEASGFRTQGLDEYPLGAFLAPAGNVHSSISDLATYALAHLAGLQGRDGFLRAETVRRLHAAPDDGARNYALGWGLARTEGGEAMHWHNGSAGTFYAFVALLPESGRAFVFAGNAGPELLEPLARKLLDTLVR